MPKSECCGTCRWHQFCESEWVCTNEEADGYGVETLYDEVCDSYESR